MASDFVHTQVVRVPGSGIEVPGAQPTDAAAHALCSHKVPSHHSWWQLILRAVVSYSQFTRFQPPKVLEKQKIKHRFLEVDHSKLFLQKCFTGVLGPPSCIISASPIICSNALPIKPFPHMLFLYPSGFAVPICCFQGSPRQRPPPVRSARGGC